jgi:sporulation protein YlmC with PRC-barrel domain
MKTMLRDDFKGRGNESDRNFEEDNLSGQNVKDKTLANMPVRVLTASSIIGDKVENFQGENLGDIRDIMLNLNTGCIEYVVLEFGGFLGIGEKLFAVPFNALTLHADRQLFLINKNKQTLKDAPGFDKDHWPETNDRHFQDVNRYWSNNTNSGYTL